MIESIWFQETNSTVGNKTIEKRDADEENNPEAGTPETENVEGQVLDKLHFEDALMMYDLCRYEKARNPDDVSVWCAAFEDEDLLVC